jgi:hypothetical protein
MKTRFAGILAGAILVLTASYAFAHHPFAAEFDWKKPITITGTVTKFEWANPHSNLYIDSKDGATVKKWAFEMGNPPTLSRIGWNDKTLKVGDTVTVDAWLAKDGSNRASVKSVILPDGREMAAGSPIFDMPQTKAPKQVKTSSSR